MPDLQSVSNPDKLPANQGSWLATCQSVSSDSDENDQLLVLGVWPSPEAAEQACQDNFRDWQNAGEDYPTERLAFQEEMTPNPTGRKAMHYTGTDDVYLVYRVRPVTVHAS